MSRAEKRQTHLVRILRRGSVSTAERMAEALGVSARTIYRDIDFLRRLGLSIEGETGVGYMMREKR